MRAAVLTSFNQPWELKSVADPKPAAGQVVVKVEASGMCGGDIHLHHGHFPAPPPIIAGHEPVGEIVEVGPGVTSLRTGDRVGVSWTQRGCGRCQACLERRPVHCREAQTWLHLGGGNAELMLAWEDGCTLVPSGVSSFEAAPIFCAGYTVMSGLRAASPRPGERIAVLGVGGLGHIALQIAKALGHPTVAITSSDGKRREAEGFGADTVVIAGDDPGAALREAGGADVILSTTNSAAQVSRALGGLRPEGRLVNLGATDGPIQVNAIQLFVTQTRLIGATMNERRDLVETLGLLAARKIKPAIEVHPLSRVNEVRDRLEAGKVRYRAILTPKD
jgi:2-desacetyl-2-hydroxyethyl bacteriochlorophyllide A dehydrogenase